MANFITLRRGAAEYVVNVETIIYMETVGNSCTIYFSKGHSLRVDHSARDVVGKALDGTKVPEEVARRARESLKAAVDAGL